MNPKQKRAKAALDELSLLRLNQREIAQRLQFDPTYVAHINGIGVHPEYHVSEERARALENLVLEVRHENALTVIESLPIAVRETANNEGAVIDQSVRDRVRQAIQLGLTNLVIDRENSNIDLPADVHGAFADIGPCVRIFVSNGCTANTEHGNLTDEDRIESQIKMLQGVIQGYRLQIHEIQHQIDELRSKLPDDKKPYHPKSAY